MLLHSRDCALRSLHLLSLGEGHVPQILREGRDSELQIEILQLEKIHQSDIPAIAKCLPWCTALRTLIVCSNVCSFTHALLDGFRQNGSLWDVVLKDTLKPSMTAQRLIEAFSHRNRRVVELLNNPANDEELLVLVPHLLIVAQQAPRMSPNNLFLGMLAGNSNIPGFNDLLLDSVSTGFQKQLKTDMVKVGVKVKRYD
jgi:hypothetical protein